MLFKAHYCQVLLVCACLGAAAPIEEPGLLKSTGTHGMGLHPIISATRVAVSGFIIIDDSDTDIRRRTLMSGRGRIKQHS